MEKENIKKIYNSIWKCFKNQDYYGVLENFEQYVSFENVGITDSLVFFYAASLEKLGFYEQALKAYQISKSLYSSALVEMKIIHLLNRLSDVENGKKEVMKLFNLETNEPYYHYLYAKFCLLEDQLEEAKYHFQKSLSGEGQFIEKTKKYLDAIEKHQNQNMFLKIGYKAFLKRGDVLKIGHIIEIKNQLEFVNGNEKNGDTKSTRRIYLIWKIDEDKVYAFSITGKINDKYDYTLSPKKYCNLSTLVTCKDNICIIDKKNITKVIEKISSDDLKKLLIVIYSEIMHNLASEQEKRIDFIQEMEKIFSLS